MTHTTTKPNFRDIQLIGLYDSLLRVSANAALLESSEVETLCDWLATSSGRSSQDDRIVQALQNVLRECADE